MPHLASLAALHCSFRLAMLEWLISNVLLKANSNYIVRDLINKDNRGTGCRQQPAGNRRRQQQEGAAGGCMHFPLNVDPVFNAKFKVKGDTDGSCQCHFRMTVYVCVCMCVCVREQ